MRTLSAPVLAAFASRSVAAVTFLELAFPSQAIYLNSSNQTYTHGGKTYLGAAGLGTITPIADQPEELPGVRLELLNVDASLIPIALDDADEVQGAPVIISTAILGGEPLAVLDVMTDWVGIADVMSIIEDGARATVVLTAESKAVDLLRGNPLLYNDADQKSLFSGDRGFAYVTSQSDQRVIWPKREWFMK